MADLRRSVEMARFHQKQISFENSYQSSCSPTPEPLKQTANINMKNKSATNGSYRKPMLQNLIDHPNMSSMSGGSTNSTSIAGNNVGFNSCNANENGNISSSTAELQFDEHEIYYVSPSKRKSSLSASQTPALRSSLRACERFRSFSPTSAAAVAPSYPPIMPSAAYGARLSGTAGHDLSFDNYDSSSHYSDTALQVLRSGSCSAMSSILNTNNPNNVTKNTSAGISNSHSSSSSLAQQQPPQQTHLVPGQRVQNNVVTFSNHITEQRAATPQNRGSLRRGKGRSNQSLCSCEVGSDTELNPDPARPLYEYSLDRRHKTHTYTCEQNAQILLRLERERNRKLSLSGGSLSGLNGGGNKKDLENDFITSSDAETIPPVPPPPSMKRNGSVRSLRLLQHFQQQQSNLRSGVMSNDNQLNNSNNKLLHHNSSNNNNNNNNNGSNSHNNNGSVATLCSGDLLNDCAKTTHDVRAVIDDCTTSILKCANAMGSDIVSNTSTTTNGSYKTQISTLNNMVSHSKPDLCHLTNTSTNNILSANTSYFANFPPPYAIHDDIILPKSQKSDPSMCFLHKASLLNGNGMEISQMIPPTSSSTSMALADFTQSQRDLQQKLQHYKNSSRLSLSKYNTIGPSSDYARQLAVYAQQQQLLHQLQQTHLKPFNERCRCFSKSWSNFSRDLNQTQCSNDATATAAYRTGNHDNHSSLLQQQLPNFLSTTATSASSGKGFDAAKHWLAVSSILLIIGAASVAVPLALRVAATAPFEERLRVALQLLDQVPLIDGHNDLPWNLRKFLHNKLHDFNFNQNLRYIEPWKLSVWSHTDLERLKKGRISAQFFAAYVPCEAQHRDAVQLTLEQIDVIQRLTEKYSKEMTACTSTQDIIETHKNHKICSLTGVEGGHSLGGSLAVLRTLYAIGVRYMTLTSTCHTPWADSSYADPPTNNVKHGGLTIFGKIKLKQKELCVSEKIYRNFVDLSTKTKENLLKLAIKHQTKRKIYKKFTKFLRLRHEKIKFSSLKSPPLLQLPPPTPQPSKLVCEMPNPQEKSTASSSKDASANSQKHRSRSSARYDDVEAKQNKRALLSIPSTIKLSMLNSGLLSFEKIKLEARDENNSLSKTIPNNPIETRHFLKLCELRRKFPVLYKLEFQTAAKVETNTCRHALRKNNHDKNQNPKCIPYDYNRVVLQKIPGVPDSDYINASYVDSLLKPNAYIVTQGPVEETVNAFWRLIWQENISAIIMLTKTFDFAKVMCVQYWPPNKDVHETYGDININIVKEEQLANFHIRTFRLYKFKEGSSQEIAEERLILQFHYTEWYSHSCPFTNAVLEFRRRVRCVVGSIIKDDDTKGPMLVHCSDGGGRSGVYLSIDANLELAEEEECFNVFGYLKKLRQSRKGLVENVEQYKFIYDTLEEHVVCGKTWFSVAELSDRLKAKARRNSLTKMNEYQMEYDKICKQTPRFTIGDCAGGHRADNREKNRDVLCVPPDNFRPYLTSFQGNAFTDYINSVFVDGYTKPREYIVTEWPMKHTLGEFWSLVYDTECSAVVVLCQPPANSQSYPSFWPIKSKLEKYGPVFSVTRTTAKSYTNIKQWEFQINKKIVSLTEMMAGVKAPTRTVQLFQLTCWPMGHKVPSSTNSLVYLMNMVEMWRAKSDYGPVCVVSPDGRSRAGVYCAANACIEQVIQHGEVDVFQAVKTVRRHRPQLVENMTEYKYCYDLVLHYVLHFLNKNE